MKTEIKKIITKLKEQIHEPSFQERHKTSENDFSRVRTLPFQAVTSFVMGTVHTSLDFEIMHFCEQTKSKKFTSSAISKARDKIKYTAFRELLKNMQKDIPSKSKLKDYRVIAFDGTKGELPNTPELMQDYRPSKDAQYPQFHAVAMFDVLNCNFIDAEFSPSPTNERSEAYELLENYDNTEKSIFLFDRGFPSIALIQKLNEQNRKFVMRVSKSFLKEVNDFGKSKAKDKQIHIDYEKRRGQTNEVKDVKLPYSFDLRCVRIELSSKTTEVLVTNLDKSEFTRAEIGKLYGLRWVIETGFNHLKNAIHVEDFVGIKENSIKQEFYATLIKYNLFLLFTEEAKMVNLYSKKNYKI